MFRKILNFLLPPLCPLCRSHIDTPHALCGACWKKIQFITKPFCNQCAHPFPFGENETVVCGKCLQHPPSFQRGRAAFKYDMVGKKLILSFKHGDATHLAPLLGQWLVQAGGDIFPQVDYIIPTPLHWTRLLKRGYNQAELLGSEVSKHTQIPFHPGILKRQRRTQSQGHLTAAARQENIKGAFMVHPKYKDLVQGKHFLVIDDVMASGSTLENAAKTLLKAGARQVDMLVLAKSLKG